MSSSVPVIDFGSGTNVPAVRHAEWVPSDDQRNLAKEIIDAFSTVGFICLVNTGITQDQIEKLVEETKKFFNKDEGYKVGYTKGVMSNVGWTAVGRETLNPAERKAGDYKETFNFQPTMPDKELPESMDVLNQWWAQSSDLACQVMKLMGLGLNLADPSIIADSHIFGSTDNETAIRVNFYPSTAGKDLQQDQIRCSEHSDYGSITLLVQDSQGLEVMNRSTKEYEAVKAPPGGVIVNIGDAMQFWTSDKLVANMHRVLVAEDPKFQAQDRVSIPFFAMPDQSTLIQCLLGDNKYPPVTMRDWLKKKIDAAFQERRGD